MSSDSANEVRQPVSVTVDLLKRVPLLHALAQEELAFLADRVALRDLAAGSVVIRQGEPGEEMYLIVSGQVRVVSDVPQERVLLAHLGPGQFFGEMALLSGEPRSAAVVASQDVRLLVLGRDDLEALLVRNPDVRSRLQGVASTRAEGGTRRFQNEAYSLLALSPANARVRIGSASDNDIVLEGAGVAPHHAEILAGSAGFSLRRVSHAPLYLNRQPIEEAPLPDDAVVSLGSRRLFVLDGVLKLFEQSRGIRVQVRGLTKKVASGLAILQDVNVDIHPGELVAIVGPSGAGKTTLLNEMLGLGTPTTGEILYDGVPLSRDPERIRRVLGYVPQYDNVHPELSVQQSLRYSGRLRLADISDAELDARIEALLASLRLSNRRDTTVGSLSGGQRKRVCVAAELVTDPGIVYLDEPTSGLDPGMDEQLMLQLRELADEGRTVILTTHATRNIRVCDRVVILHGGLLIFAGPPAEALQYFGVEDFAEIYALLEARKPSDAAEQYRQHLAEAGHSSEPVVTASPDAAPREAVSGLAQLKHLISRDIRVLRKDRVNMGLRIFGAPLLALTQLAAFDGTIFASALADGGNAQQSLVLLYLSAAICVFLSAFTSANVITREGGIYRRERLVGLSALSYVGAKVAVLSVFAVLQGALFIAVLAIKIDFPGSAVETLSLLAAALVAVSLAGMSMGLFISSLSPNADRASILVVLALVPQLIFAGATVPRSEMSVLSKTVSELTITKWSIELTGGIAEMDERFDSQAILQVPVESGPPKQVAVPYQPFSDAFTGRLWPRWVALFGFSVVFISGTLFVQSRKGRPR